MFLAAARTLANFTRSHDTSDNCLYPRLRELRAVSKLIAFKVAQTARDEGCGRSLDDAELQTAIEEFVWFAGLRFQARRSRSGAASRPRSRARRGGLSCCRRQPFNVGQASCLPPAEVPTRAGETPALHYWLNTRRAASSERIRYSDRLGESGSRLLTRTRWEDSM